MSTIAFKLQVLANLLRCGKRKPSGNGAGGAEDQVTEKSGMADIPNETNVYETTLGKASPETDFANEATTDGPSDGSDSEGSSVDASMATQQATPPNLLPPGLEATLAMKAGRVDLPKSVPSDLNEVLKKLSPEDAMTVLARFELTQFAHLFPEEAAAGETQKTSKSGGAKQKQKEAERPALGAKEEVAHNPRIPQTNDMRGLPKPEELLSLLNKSQRKKGAENCDAIKIYDDPPWRKPPDCPTDNTEGSLRSNLKKMSLIDSSRIFMARKIKPLGLNSPKALWGYFQQFGPVEDVFVTHSLNKEDPSLTRPAGTGFIAMKNAEDVLKVLQQEHVIRRVRIVVEKYEHRQRS